MIMVELNADHNGFSFSILIISIIYHLLLVALVG